jgi:hypothetical protein
MAEVRAASTKLPSVSFYTTANSRYFPGVAAMVNSLRVLGHDEVIHVLDCGLEPAQRALLAREATIVPAGDSRVPHLQKYVLPLERPAEVMVLVDADVILTRPLGELLAAAGDGRVVAFSDRVPDRYFAEWGELLDLASVTPRTYLNVGLVALPRELGTRILERAQAGLASIDVGNSMLAAGPPSYPFSYLEQDVFNAVLSALAEPSNLLTLELRLAPVPPFVGVRVVDEARLRCRYADGAEPFALHHLDRKPWLVPTRANAYSRLLTRLLLDPSAAVPVESECLPLRLRKGALASYARREADVLAVVGGARRGARRAAHWARYRTSWSSPRPAPGATR